MIPARGRARSRVHGVFRIDATILVVAVGAKGLDVQRVRYHPVRPSPRPTAVHHARTPSPAFAHFLDDRRPPRRVDLRVRPELRRVEVFFDPPRLLDRFDRDLPPLDFEPDEVLFLAPRFLAPPERLFTVAHPIRSAAFFDPPRALTLFSILCAVRFCLPE
jgi:hypothetical protein